MKVRRVDFYPDDWIAGTIALTNEQRGVYIAVVAHIYATGNRLPDDDRLVAGLCRLDIRVYRRIKSELIRAKKFETSGGLLANFRATSEIDRSLARSQLARELGRIGGRKSGAVRSNNNDLTEANAQANGQAETPSRNEANSQQSSINNKNPSVPDGTDGRASGPDPFELAVQGWNDLAGRLGLARVQRLTDARKSKLRNRLAECGGLEGWNAALGRVEASAFLRGDRTDWKCDFDFLLQAKSFTKLMEGAYDDGPRNGTANPGHTRASGSFAAATAAAAEILDRARTGHEPLDRAAGDHPGGQGLDPFGDP